MNKSLTIDLFHWITIKKMWIAILFWKYICTDVHTLMNYIPCFVVFSKSIYLARHALHLRFHEIFSKHMNNFDNPVTLGSKHKLSEGIAWQRSVVARFTIKHSRYTTAHCYIIEIICPVNRKEPSVDNRSDPQPKSRGFLLFFMHFFQTLRKH